MTAEELVAGTIMEQWLEHSDGSNVDDNGDGTYHVTIYIDDGGHVSGECDGNGNAWDVHATLYNYDEDGKRGDTDEDIIIEF